MDKSVEQKSVEQIIYEVREDICYNFCKYGDTFEQDSECEWLKCGNECPLWRL